MQVSNPNNIKIYNLSAGKSLPDWLTDRKKRQLQHKDVEIQRRIELLQDFNMPTVSSCVRVSPDNQYICATGIYKPRVRCFDVSQMSMKFERCMDSEIIKFCVLSEDYSKLVFLQADRYIEFHVQHGRHYRTRIPKYGRDLSYYSATSDLYLVGAGSEVYRLNLEHGRFMSSLKTDASEIFCCQFNPVHQLFACGTKEGHVECWDPRVRNRVGKLDCAASLTQDTEVDEISAITSLQFKDGLSMAAGTSTGQVLLYDLRSDKPLLEKDHHYGLPIRSIQFHPEQNLVMSMDKKILKLWHQNTGKPFTSIEPGVDMNDLCHIPDTGMMFMANEAPKILTYYIPALGPAPRWCSFLDSLAEELEESANPSVYDDYKFVTRTEVESLGLAHLVGTSLFRGYMHGYFMDNRLYNKAKMLAEPFAYDTYKKSKIREKIEEARKNRVQIRKLPKVNRSLAEKLMDQEEGDPPPKRKGKKDKEMPNLMKDSRFSSMFDNPDFQVDTESDEYRLLNPLVNRLDKQREKKTALQEQFETVQEEDEEVEGKPSEDDSSSDDDDRRTLNEELRKQHRMLRYERVQEERREKKGARFLEVKGKNQLDSVHAAGSKTVDKKAVKLSKRTLGERLVTESEAPVQRMSATTGNLEMSYVTKNTKAEKDKDLIKEHRAERKDVHRSAKDILKSRKLPKFNYRR